MLIMQLLSRIDSHDRKHERKEVTIDSKHPGLFQAWRPRQLPYTVLQILNGLSLFQPIAAGNKLVNSCTGEFQFLNGLSLFQLINTFGLAPASAQKFQSLIGLSLFQLRPLQLHIYS